MVVQEKQIEGIDSLMWVWKVMQYGEILEKNLQQWWDIMECFNVNGGQFLQQLVI